VPGVDQRLPGGRVLQDLPQVHGGAADQVEEAGAADLADLVRVEGVGPAEDVEAACLRPERLEPRHGLVDQPARVLVGGAGGHDEHLVGAGGVEQPPVERAAVGERGPTDESDMSAGHGPQPTGAEHGLVSSEPA
jgi:hypothetical protein